MNDEPEIIETGPISYVREKVGGEPAEKEPGYMHRRGKEFGAGVHENFKPWLIVFAGLGGMLLAVEIYKVIAKK